MKQITDFLGKPVLSLYEGNVEGYVKNVIFDKNFKKMKYLVIFEDNEFQDEKMLDASKVYNYGESAITIKNNSCLELKKEEILEIQNHINCKVYTTLGDYIGIIADIEIDEKNFTISNVILTNKQKIKPNQFLTFGQDVFFMQNEDKPIKIANIKKKDNILTNTTNQPSSFVSILPLQNNVDALSTIKENNQDLNNQGNVESQSILKESKKYTFNDNSLPRKIVVNNTDFLIGKKTTKTIYSSNNEIIVKKNTLINQKIIKQALIYNKLRELSIYSA